MPLTDLAHTVDLEPVALDAEVEPPRQPAQQPVDVTAFERGYRAAIAADQVVLVSLLDRHIRVIFAGGFFGGAPVYARQPVIIQQQIHRAVDCRAADWPSVAAKILEQLLGAKWLCITYDALQNGSARLGHAMALGAQMRQDIICPRHWFTPGETQ